MRRRNFIGSCTTLPSLFSLNAYANPVSTEVDFISNQVGQKLYVNHEHEVCFSADSQIATVVLSPGQSLGKKSYGAENKVWCLPSALYPNQNLFLIHNDQESFLLEYSERSQKVFLKSILPSEFTDRFGRTLIGKDDQLLYVLDSSETSYGGIFGFLNQETGSLRFLGCHTPDEFTDTLEIDLLFETAESFINVNNPIRILYYNEQILPHKKNVFLETQAGVGLKLYQFFFQNDSFHFEVLHHVSHDSYLLSSCGSQFPFHCGFDSYMPDDKDEFLRLFYFDSQPNLLFYRHKNQQIYTLSFSVNEGAVTHHLTFLSTENFATRKELSQALFPTNCSGTSHIVFLDPQKQTVRLGKFSGKSGEKTLDIYPVALSQDVQVTWESIFHSSVFCLSSDHASGIDISSTLAQSSDLSFVSVWCDRNSDDTHSANNEAGFQKINLICSDDAYFLRPENSQKQQNKPRLNMNRPHKIAVAVTRLGIFYSLMQNSYALAMVSMDPEGSLLEKLELQKDFSFLPCSFHYMRTYRENSDTDCEKAVVWAGSF